MHLPYNIHFPLCILFYIYYGIQLMLAPQLTHEKTNQQRDKVKDVVETPKISEPWNFYQLYSIFFTFIHGPNVQICTYVMGLGSEISKWYMVVQSQGRKYPKDCRKEESFGHIRIRHALCGEQAGSFKTLIIAQES